jgi:hypothetical protein
VISRGVGRQLSAEKHRLRRVPQETKTRIIGRRRQSNFCSINSLTKTSLFSRSNFHDKLLSVLTLRIIV